ncbi:MAG: glycosyltransferase, partial [Candidatus Micrarchaeia archaeon]
DYIIAVSTQTKEEAIKLGFDKKDIFVVNLGIDKRFLKNKLKRERNKANFVVGYLGAMRKRKNLEFAIKAFNLISDPKIKFDIWGKKEYEYEHLTSVSKNKNINFKGFAPEDKIVYIYDSFDAFVFPSFHEGFGMPILEAQARGLPVIIYKNAMIPKEVRKYCIEAESPEHMAQIIENLKKNGYDEKLRKEAMEYARNFTWDDTIKKIVDVYKDVLKREGHIN